MNFLKEPLNKTILQRTIILTVATCVVTSTLLVNANELGLIIAIPVYACFLLSMLVYVKYSSDLFDTLPKWASKLQIFALIFAIPIVLLVPAKTTLFTFGFSLLMGIFLLIPTIGGWVLWSQQRRRKINAALRAEWYNQGVVRNVLEDACEESSGLNAWIAELDADTLHEIATLLIWDGGTSVLSEILKNPSCDRSTAMSVYALADASAYEVTYPGRSDEASEILDVLLNGFRNGQYRSGCFQLHEDFSLDELKEYRDTMRVKNQTLRWDMPDRAFDPLSDKAHDPKYELIHGEVLMIPFEEWLAQRN